MSETKTTSFNAWIGENAARLMHILTMDVPLDEDAFQDAYLYLVSVCRKQDKGKVFEKAFVAVYRKLTRKAVVETYTTAHPEEFFFALLQKPPEMEISDRQREDRTESLAMAIKAHIRTTYSRNDVAIWEMYIGGTSIRDIADALGISRPAVNKAMRRIAEQTRAQFSLTF